MPALITSVCGANHCPGFVHPACPPVSSPRQLVGQAIAEALPKLLVQGLRQVLGRVPTTGEPFRNPVHVELEGQPDTHCQRFT